jgi:hypothetical protein
MENGEEAAEEGGRRAEDGGAADAAEAEAEADGGKEACAGTAGARRRGDNADVDAAERRSPLPARDPLFAAGHGLDAMPAGGRPGPRAGDLDGDAAGAEEEEVVVVVVVACS